MITRMQGADASATSFPCRHTVTHSQQSLPSLPCDWRPTAGRHRGFPRRQEAYVSFLLGDVGSTGALNQ